MAEEVKEPQDSPNPAEKELEKTEEPKTEEPKEEPKQETVPKSEFEQALARAKKAEEKLKKIKELDNENPPPPQVETKSQDSDIEAVLQLRSEGFSDREILDLRRKSIKYKTDLTTLLEDEDIKLAIEAKREKNKVEESTPSPSKRGPVKIGDKTVAEMKPEERKKLDPEEWRRQFQKRG